VSERNRDPGDFAARLVLQSHGVLEEIRAFKEEAHGTVFAETVVYDPFGEWEASWNADVQNFVFVAMPQSGDKWASSMTFRITPSGDHNR
jgi:hypothetical protein